MDYLGIVNKVIQESASEADELTTGTWSSAEAGRRLYPRIKRNVADAWKSIQLKRDTWEFMTAELSTVVYPRIKVVSGLRVAGAPPVGSVFIGDSGFTFTVKQVLDTTGSWTLGTATATIEFDTHSGPAPERNDTFTEVSPVLGDGEFLYIGKGSYDFSAQDATLREVQWETFIANASGTSPIPVQYVPWDHWSYDEYAFETSSTPLFVSQDYQGRVVFYPQPLDSFRVKFIAELAPQILSASTDVPSRIPDEYHEWIAWEALMKLALFDKNPDLFAYAREQATVFSNKAERHLMPRLSYAASPFNRV